MCSVYQKSLQNQPYNRQGLDSSQSVTWFYFPAVQMMFFQLILRCVWRMSLFFYISRADTQRPVLTPTAWETLVKDSFLGLAVLGMLC